VLGHVIGVEPRLLLAFDQFEPRLIEIIKRQIFSIQMVEDAEFNITRDIS
jgi:hypothetical protein